MRTRILTLPAITRQTGRWLLALALALALTLALFAQAQAIGACTTPTQFIDLWAKTGTYTLPDSTTVPIWGYANSAGGTAQLPGPALSVTEGTCVQVTLHNDLAEATSLALHGQGLAADRTGAPAAGTRVYTFSATRPGTYLYEAGLTTNGARQVGMGLYGALIVQPATPSTAYSSETTLVLSEIDPDLNAAPTTFDMGDYRPRYWLINGVAYTTSSSVNASIASGSTALIRYINAGLNENSMGVLGLDQQVAAADGYAVPPYTVVAETIPPGSTLDTLITIPAGTADGTQFPVYSAAQYLDNNSVSYGGQLMFITVGAPLAPVAGQGVNDAKGQTPPAEAVPQPVDASKPADQAR